MNIMITDIDMLLMVEKGIRGGMCNFINVSPGGMYRQIQSFN